LSSTVCFKPFDLPQISSYQKLSEENLQLVRTSYFKKRKLLLKSAPTAQIYADSDRRSQLLIVSINFYIVIGYTHCKSVRMFRAYNRRRK